MGNPARYAALVLAAVISPVCAQSQSVSSGSAPARGNSGSSPVTISRFFTATDNNGLWASCIDFTNVTTRRMTAIQFKFTYWDAFDTPVKEFQADRVGEFAPGVLIQGPQSIDESGGGNVSQKVANCWRIGASIGSISKVTAQVVKVRYGDGEIWSAEGAPAVFTGTYMGGGAGYVDPPQKLHCSLFTWSWSWVEANGHGYPKVINCVKEWERANGNVAGWPTPEPSATPSTP